MRIRSGLACLHLATIDTFLSAYVIVPLRESTGKRAYELLKLYANPTAYTTLTPWLRQPR